MCALLPFSYLKFNMKHMAVRTAHLRTYLNRLFLCPNRKKEELSVENKNKIYCKKKL